MAWSTMSGSSTPSPATAHTGTTTSADRTGDAVDATPNGARARFARSTAGPTTAAAGPAALGSPIYEELVAELGDPTS